jgi:hypothetical protein
MFSTGSVAVTTMSHQVDLPAATLEGEESP